jgi:VacB/RNase II family 3'-5' exoribonuclease
VDEGRPAAHHDSMTSSRNRLREIAHRVLIERGLAPDFPPKVLAAAQELGPAKDPGIRDLRGLLWCSIDNDDSRDLDQLTVAEALPGGRTRVLVAIADVDALVPKGSPIDEHARVNTTSVYTAAEVFPMLPERLSTDLTSLVENEDRLAIVIEMTIEPDGGVSDSSIARASVRNRAKLAYRGVAAWLEGGSPPAKLAAVRGLEDQVRLQDAAAQAMKDLRHRHGALTLETLEPKALFDGEVLSDLLPDEKNRAKELIEDFMIGANGVTARFLDHSGFPAMRRVLPEPERWDRIVSTAAAYGENLPDRPDARALQQFLVRRLRADPVGFPDVSLSIVKLLGSGEYALEMPGHDATGHFGLAARDYAHSTAPNRRYPDLITQRLIKAAMAGARSPYTAAEIQVLAQHCTEQEDAATKAERQVRKSAAALILERRVGERFDAIVTGASAKGSWVRIPRPAVEGKLVRGAQGLDVGDRVRVQLVDTDVERGFIDFARA